MSNLRFKSSSFRFALFLILIDMASVTVHCSGSAGMRNCSDPDSNVNRGDLPALELQYGENYRESLKAKGSIQLESSSWSKPVNFRLVCSAPYPIQLIYPPNPWKNVKSNCINTLRNFNVFFYLNLKVFIRMPDAFHNIFLNGRNRTW